MNTRFDWRDMLHFDKMISPTFLTILYYVQISLSTLFSLYYITKGLDVRWGGGYMVMRGLLWLIIGPFLIRLGFELLIVVFKIHTRLSNIDYTLRGTNPPAHPIEPLTSTPVAPNQGIPFPPVVPAPGYSPEPFQSYNQNLPPVQPVFQNPVAQTQPSFEIPSLPVGRPTPGTKPEFQDFWSNDQLRPGIPGPTAPPVNVDPGKWKGNLPNWPVTVASILILYGIIAPYASINANLPVVGNLFGDIASSAYSIKNSPLGPLAILGALAMLFTSAAGLKWIWFIVSYSITTITSVFAFIGDSSLFSHLSRVKTGLNSLQSSMGQYSRGGDQFANEIAESTPGITSLLSVSFYLFFIAMLFAGFWALAGKYTEKGFMN